MMTLSDAIESVDRKFNSCNTVEVTRTQITREEWEALRAHITLLEVNEDKPVAWYIDCEEPELKLKYRSVTFNPCDVTKDHKPLYTNLTSREAKAFDRARETPRRQQAVELLIAMGWSYDPDLGWDRETHPAAQEAANPRLVDESAVDSAYAAGMVAGWNYGIADDRIGFDAIRSRKLSEACAGVKEAAKPVGEVDDAMIDRAMTAYDEFLGSDDEADYEAMRAALIAATQDGGE